MSRMPNHPTLTQDRIKELRDAATRPYAPEVAVDSVTLLELLALAESCLAPSEDVEGVVGRLNALAILVEDIKPEDMRAGGDSLSTIAREAAALLTTLSAERDQWRDNAHASMSIGAEVERDRIMEIIGDIGSRKTGELVPLAQQIAAAILNKERHAMGIERKRPQDFGSTDDRFGIISPYGSVWTYETFLSEEMAWTYLCNWWGKPDGALRQQGFTVERVSLRVRRLKQKAKANA